MRTKEEILENSRRDIQMRDSEGDAPLWLEYRRIEVLIDIRDILEIRIPELISSIYNTLGKD